MTVLRPDRGLAGSSASWSAWRGKQGNTTARWQDKGARCAPRFGCVFSMAYAVNSRGALARRSLRIRRFPKQISAIARCAVLPP